MTLMKMALKNVLNRPWSTTLSVLMLTMGVALASLLVSVGGALESGFKKNIAGIDMVVGAKGSPLQLILSAVYQIDSPTGNIPLSEAEKIAHNPLVAKFIPLSYGDSYRGAPIVGTTHGYVGLYGADMERGRLWNKNFEATLGVHAAEMGNLDVGDTLYSAHGTDEFADVHHTHGYKVVGILKKTGTVMDRLILTTSGSIRELHGGEASRPDEREITAALISFKNKKTGVLTLPRAINRNTNMQAALPAIEINRLLGLFDVAISVLRTVALAILVLGALSIFISMLSALRTRAFEMALVRSMGGGRTSVFMLVVIEALLLAVIGIVLGLLLSFGALAYLIDAYGPHYGAKVSLINFGLKGGYIALATFVICFLAAVVPAWLVSKADILKTLNALTN